MQKLQNKQHAFIHKEVNPRRQSRTENTILFKRNKMWMIAEYNMHKSNKHHETKENGLFSLYIRIEQGLEGKICGVGKRGADARRRQRLCRVGWVSTEPRCDPTHLISGLRSKCHHL